MGKALIIGGVILTLAVIAGTITLLIRRQGFRQDNLAAGRATRGDLNREQENRLEMLVDDARYQIDRLLNPPPHLALTAVDIDVLSAATKAHLQQWMVRYNQVRRPGA